MSLAPPFGIPIDLIHNTNQTINANIGKRAKLVLALYYIYCSLHIEQWLHILIIWMACSLQRPKHCKITTFKNPPPLLPALSLYIYTYIYTYIYYINTYRKIDRCVIPMYIYMMLYMRACTVSQCISWISKAHWQPPRWCILLPGSHELLWRWLGPSFRPRFCSKHTTCRVQGATECGCRFLVLNHLLFE